MPTILAPRFPVVVQLYLKGNRKIKNLFPLSTRCTVQSHGKVACVSGECTASFQSNAMLVLADSREGFLSV